MRTRNHIYTQELNTNTHVQAWAHMVRVPSHTGGGGNLIQVVHWWGLLTIVFLVRAGEEVAAVVVHLKCVGFHTLRHSVTDIHPDSITASRHTSRQRHSHTVSHTATQTHTHSVTVTQAHYTASQTRIQTHTCDQWAMFCTDVPAGVSLMYTSRRDAFRLVDCKNGKPIHTMH